MNKEENYASSEAITEKTKRKWIPYLLAFCVFGIALGLRLDYVLTLDIDGPIRDDALKYYKLAYNLVENGVYSKGQSFPFTIETAITPGYPLFLAAIMSLMPDVAAFYKMTLLLQAVLSALTVFLVYFISCRCLPWFCTILGIFLIAISPHLIIYSGYVLTETLFTFLLVLGMFLYVVGVGKNNIAWQMSAGMVWGMASLTRPALFLFPVALFIFSCLFVGNKKYMLKGHLALICGLLVLWLPWKIFIFNEPPTINAAAASFAFGSYPNLVFKSEKLRGYPYREDPAYNEMKRDIRNGLAVVAERAREEPVRYVKWYVLGKPKMYWGAYTVTGVGGAFVYGVKSTMYHRYKTLRASYTKMMHAHAFLAALALLYSCVSIIKCISAKAFDAGGFIVTCFGLLLFYFTLIHMVFAPLPRYAVPLYPFCYMLAAGSLSLPFAWGKRLIFKRK